MSFIKNNPTSCFLFWFLFLGLTTNAQPTYNMGNLSVNDCEGVLLDSDAGDVDGTYDHNENYTFTICVPGTDMITLNFVSFCTEEDFDFIRFFDGPDTLSTQIGPAYSGTVAPPTVVATSGCLTIHFISDPNVACTGWVANWAAEVDEPEPPEFLPLGEVDCESNTLIVELDRPVLCDSILPGAFSISGAQIINVVDATPLNCMDGEATQIELTLSPEIQNSGSYQVSFLASFLDVCQRLRLENVRVSFQVSDCPLNVLLYPEEDPICAGTCTQLIAEAAGGDGNYSYQWEPPILPPQDQVQVCPDIPSSTYSVTVTDGNGSTAADTITITPIPFPVITGMDSVVCESEEFFDLEAVPGGGDFTAQGITWDDRRRGYYYIDRVPGTIDTVRYVAPNGCETILPVTIIPLDEGTDDGACTGAAPFQVSGGLPAGGVWSGPNITPDGLFSPPPGNGTYDVTYTHPNGCSGTKTIEIGGLNMPNIDTLCRADDWFQIPVTPYGGVWSGPGIINPNTGLFGPSEANLGDNTLIYNAENCSDTLVIHVRNINARWDLTACPDQSPFILPGNIIPAGGTWSGYGIIDSLTGLYDPSISSHGDNHVVTYTVDGCQDSRIVRVRNTAIYLEDTLQFCPEDDRMVLNWGTVQRAPGGGSWTGPGIQQHPTNNNVYYFNPAVAGSGFHTVYYALNECQDSISFIVHPTPNITEEDFCEAQTPITLTVDPPGGTWWGDGIADENKGIFDPELVGIGTWTVFNESENGCIGSAEIDVTPKPEASLDGVQNFYCYKDTVYSVSGEPAGGQLLINGMPATSINPVALGPGVHNISYSIGSGRCRDEANAVFQVGDPVDVALSAQNDTLCFGQGVEITAQGMGGSSFGNYVYTWDSGLGFGQTHFVTPGETTQYSVTVEDGCSDPANGNLEVFVHEEIQPYVVTGPPVCYEDTTFAEISADPPGNYNFIWDTDPPYEGNMLFSYPTTYDVLIQNLDSGCETDTTVELPGYGILNAGFNFSPNKPCLGLNEAEIELLDFSVGAIRGYWEFGDSTPPVPYSPGQTVTHEYQDTGRYIIALHIENEGSCISEIQKIICIEAEHTLFAPNAFTPDFDGKNDVFHLVGTHLKELNWKVFNRWGELIFESNSLEDGWDGRFKEQRVSPGVYTYIARYIPVGSNQEKTIKGFVTVIY